MFSSKYKIKQIVAREILDSRGNPNVEAKIVLNSGVWAKASVPSGASTGSFEAWELRDGGKRLGGKGTKKAVANINRAIENRLIGRDIRKLRQLDQMMIELDGTPSKKKLGANAILGVSLAAAHTGAKATKQPLYRYLRQAFELRHDRFAFPVPMMNIINGGRHADNGLSIQEFMIVPKAPTMAQRVWRGVEVFHSLKSLLHEDGYMTLVGDEGGFAPTLKQNQDALDYIVRAIEAAGFRPGKDVAVAMDLASSEFYEKRKGYDFDFKLDSKGKNYQSADDITELLSKWIDRYHIISIEDPLNEESWAAWKSLTKTLGKKVQIVGDDLFVTNAQRLQKGLKMGVANAILIKVNQIGTLSETIDAIELAQAHKYGVIISHRSGETGDTTIADLSVAVNAEYIKTGSLSRSERVEKYNRLMEIELELQGKW